MTIFFDTKTMLGHAQFNFTHQFYGFAIQGYEQICKFRDPGFH